VTVFTGSGCQGLADSFCISDDKGKKHGFDKSVTSYWLGDNVVSSFTLPPTAKATFYSEMNYEGEIYEKIGNLTEDGSVKCFEMA